MSNLERWFNNKKIAPLRNFTQFEDSFDRMLNEMITTKGDVFTPSCEVTEEGNCYLLKFDMPGVSKNQVKVEVIDNQITVSAERKEEKKHESKKKFLSEFYYGSYSRSFTLPGAVDEKKVDAKFENGVLTVTIPKTEALQTKQIPVL